MYLYGLVDEDITVKLAHECWGCQEFQAPLSLSTKQIYFRYQLKGFGGRSKQKAQRTESFAQRLHRHEYEVDERSKGEKDDGKNGMLNKGMVETPRGSWASRYELLVLFIKTKEVNKKINFEYLVIRTKSL